jgi:hypothetical protein
VAAVGGTLWLGWRGFGPLAGLLAAGLYAASPSAVFYARRLWEPDVHPAVAVLLFVALELGIVGRRAWWAAASFPIVMLGAGVHWVFLTLAPIGLAPAADLLRRRRWLALAVGLGAALLLTVPVFLHLRATDFQEYRDLRYRATQPSTVDLDGLLFTLRVSTGWHAPVAEVLPLAEVLPTPLAEAVPGASLALLLGGAALAVGRLVWPSTPGEVRVRLAGLLAWLLVPAVLSVRHQSDLHPHYYLMTVPASFLLIGAGVQWLVSGLGRRAVLGVAAAAGVLMALESVAVAGLLDLVATTPQACYGAPLVVARETAADLLAFGDSAQRVVFENDEAGDVAGLAYLARPGFAQLGVPKPDLAGLTGPGVHAPELARAPGPLSASAERLGATYGPGVQVASASLATDAWPGWRPRLAIRWQAEPTLGGRLVWQADLVDGSGASVRSEQGQPHAELAELAGQATVSVFSFDVPGSLPAGDYRARLRLVGAPGEWLSRPVHVAPPSACVRSVMP